MPVFSFSIEQNFLPQLKGVKWSVVEVSKKSLLSFIVTKCMLVFWKSELYVNYRIPYIENLTQVENDLLVKSFEKLKEPLTRFQRKS